MKVPCVRIRSLSPTPMPPSPLWFPEDYSEDDSELDRLYDEYRGKLRSHKMKRRMSVQRYQELREAHALQDKRDRWKAASARYYERHPEVKEKKRLKAAELRAANKLARRRWDPPRRAKVVTIDAPVSDETRDFSIDVSAEVVVGLRCTQDDAAESLLGLRAGLPPDPADIRSAPEETMCLREESEIDVMDAWANLAPQYASSNEE
ncbi:hypothetical protein C8R45DRAFT_919292 [Mycena sanguinolenta]|nr:hypothetical protein C8R45DRAFT_919292 [Mycena sanguinolenta]